MHALVVATGAGLSTAARALLPAGALVVAADGGVDAALALELTVDVAVGDFDSVSAAGLAAVEAAGALVERHPAAKDATDLELAIDIAVERGATSVTVLGAPGGRLDHLLAAAALVAAPRHAGVRRDAWFGDSRLYVVTEEAAADVVGTPGALVTLIAWHGPVAGVRTAGLHYPLADEPLDPGSSRGVSNVLVEARATVSVRGGTLLVVVPEPNTDA